MNKKDGKNLQISGTRENVEIKKITKKLTDLLEKRNITGFTVKASGNTVKLALPHIDDKEREKLLASIKEIPGSEMIKFEKTDKTMVSDEEIEDAFRDLLGKYLPNEKKVSGGSKGGNLSIFGTASSIYARDAILDLAKECTGVKKVLDQMRVPQSKSDINLANSVMLALGNEQRVMIWHLQIIVKSGVVFVSGNAKDKESIHLSSEVIQKVPGVKGVENGVRHQTEGVNPDDELKIKIIEELRKSTDVRARDINPVTINGNVFLKGYAATTREIIAAEAMVSKIKGVKKVFMELEPKL
ncbi:MAG: BON domain-containing protein [Caldiserica bacterium]|nr:BON domain-containing protein [Caldisericota bacterium]